MRQKTEGLSDKFLLQSFYVMSAFIALMCLMPFWLLISNSISDEGSLLKYGYRLFPLKISFEAYNFVFQNSIVLNSYLVTIFVTIAGTALSLIFTGAVAYAISVKSLRYRNGIALYVYLTMLFSGGLVPTYILISRYLHLKNSIWVLILPALINPWYLFLLRNFFKTLPESLHESAKIDGANEIVILLKIIFPLALPAMATVGLFYALGYWNEWFRAILYIDNKNLYPLQYLIMQILKSINFYASGIAEKYGMSFNKDKLLPAYSSRMATAFVTIGPIILVYPFVQKYFIKGLTMGAVKG